MEINEIVLKRFSKGRARWYWLLIEQSYIYHLSISDQGMTAGLMSNKSLCDVAQLPPLSPVCQAGAGWRQFFYRPSLIISYEETSDMRHRPDTWIGEVGITDMEIKDRNGRGLIWLWGLDTGNREASDEILRRNFAPLYLDYSWLAQRLTEGHS